MKDLKLDDNYDISVEGGTFSSIENPDLVAQKLLLLHTLVLGEWDFDVTAGLPWFDDILVKNPNLPVIELAFRQQILSIDQIDAIDEFEIDLDDGTGVLDVSYAVTLRDGSTAEVSTVRENDTIEIQTLTYNPDGTITECNYGWTY